jgi:hypothetical protein
VEALVDRSDASALADLQMHWDEAYTIGLDGDIWLARFHGTADELRAHTSTELRELIRADYAFRQQARRVRDLDDDDLEFDDYGAHRDSARSDGGSARDPQAGRQAESSRAAWQDASYASIRGERMST